MFKKYIASVILSVILVLGIFVNPVMSEPLLSVTLDTYNRDGTPGYGGVSFGNISPLSPVLINNPYALRLSVISDYSWGLGVRALDHLKNGSHSIDISNLEFAEHGSLSYTPFSLNVLQILLNQSPTPGKDLYYDLLLNPSWDTYTGSYCTSLEYDITVEDTIAPVISVITGNISTNQNTANVTATITDNVAVQKASIFYRNVGVTNFTEVSMVNTSGDLWQAPVFINNNNVEYYIKAWDYGSNTSRNPVEPDFYLIAFDNIAPNGTILIINGAAYTNSPFVTLNLTANDPFPASGIEQMRFSNDETTWSVWEPYGSLKAWTLATGDGTKTVQAQFKDYAGNVCTVSDNIVLDTATPSASITINNSATYTNVGSVTLNVNSVDVTSGVYQMRLSNDGSTWSTWEAYAGSKVWTLASGDGLKTVYAQFMDKAGNVSNTASDTIIFDTTAPSGTLTSSLNVNSTSVTLILNATDVNSGVYQMRFSNNGSTWSTWESYTTAKAWTLVAGDGTKTVYAQFKDNAGNISVDCTCTIILDTVSPTGTITTSEYNSSSVISLTVAFSDDRSGVSQMRFSNNGSTWSVWESAKTTKSWTLVTGDGAKVVYAQFKDNAGNVSTNATCTTILDAVIPSGTVSINGGAAYTNSTAVTITLNASDATSGVGQMRFSNDGSTWSTWEIYATLKTWTLATGNGTKTVYTQFKDKAGNVSNNASDSIFVDTVKPSGTVVISGGATYATNTAVTLTLSASDPVPTSGIYQMRFSNDGSTWSAWEAYATSRAWSLAVGEGTKTVYAQYKDNAGNVSSSVTDTVILDSVDPSISITDPSTNEWVCGTVTITASASDGGSGMSKVEFYADGTLLGSDTSSSGGWTYSWDTVPYANGTNTNITAKAYDKAGNVASSIVYPIPSLVNNSSFENDSNADGKPDSWASFTSYGNWGTSSFYKKYGSHSAYANDTSNVNGFGIGQSTPLGVVVPGQTYTGVTWFYTYYSLTNGSGVYLQLTFYNSSWGILGQYNSSSSISYGTWTKVSLTKTAPSGTAYVNIRELTDQETTGTVYVDGMHIVKGSNSNY